MLDALDSGDDAKFADELGDLLLQVLFTRKCRGRKTLRDRGRDSGVHDKMIRRHPRLRQNARQDFR